MYINVNMGTLEQFDPHSAIEYWMHQRNRRPKLSGSSREQEWFHGVFDDSSSGHRRNIRPKIEF